VLPSDHKTAAIATPLIDRCLSGGRAQFSTGLKIEHFDLKPRVRLTNKMNIEAEANTIHIPKWLSPKENSRHLKASLENIIGPTRFICVAKDRSLTVGFRQPEHAHKALEYFKRENRLRRQLKYTVQFVVPEDIVRVVQGLLDGVVREMNHPIIREGVSNGETKLRIEGMQQQVIAKMKKKIENVSLKWPVVTPNPEHVNGGIPSHSDFWHDFFSTSPGQDWIRQFNIGSTCVLSADKAQQRLRLYGKLSNSEETDKIESILVGKIEELWMLEDRHVSN
jgi:hypothetical protein